MNDEGQLIDMEVSLSHKNSFCQNKPSKGEIEIEDFRIKFMMQLSNWFWQLLGNRPVNSEVAPVGQHLFSHIEATVQAIIEIFHAFTTTVDLGESTSANAIRSISLAGC